MDFTFKIFEQLFQTFIEHSYQLIPFEHYLKSNSDGIKIILRHDVDLLPQHALHSALIESEMGIKGTYYFRIVPESYEPFIMEKIASLGHEIGYHYEDIDLVLKKQNYQKKFSYNKLKKNPSLRDELLELAYESFCKNLENLRKHFDIKTICMHGSPLSPYDNKWIWEKYDYKQLGILGEPYMDIDWTMWAYYTDTGRRWNGDKVSVRDKINASMGSGFMDKNKINKQSDLKKISNWPVFKSTDQMIELVKNELFPSKAMITIHPQRWTNNLFLWSKEFLLQNIKNLAKIILIQKRRKMNF